jgi:hypothetical protein
VMLLGCDKPSGKTQHGHVLPLDDHRRLASPQGLAAQS